jgi:hypothetical protein
VRRVLLLQGYAGDPFRESGVRRRRDVAQPSAAYGQRGRTGGTSITILSVCGVEFFTHAVDEQPIPSGKIRANLGENKSGSKSESESQDGSDQNEWEEILEQYDAALPKNKIRQTAGEMYTSLYLSNARHPDPLQLGFYRSL